MIGFSKTIRTFCGYRISAFFCCYIVLCDIIFFYSAFGASLVVIFLSTTTTFEGYRLGLDMRFFDINEK
ncbi:hypothetical protein CKA38_10595 [Ereboglobus luteus]|uniref:Uncharacterized protein n=1 Tax=Ereboglobus luteus TaxID=1796921 RepID=A0A2U8E4E1_9BACT|nr:hypothetical protein CKA38_10595 [Ereboglobus luteus]